MNISQAFERVISHLNSRLSLYSGVSAARLSEEGISVQLLGGRDKESYLDGGRLRELPLLFLAKSNTNRKALDALTKIVSELENALPEGFCTAETVSSPALVDKGERSVLYEAQVTLGFYEKNAAE